LQQFENLSIFNSGDTSTAWIITHSAPPRRYVQLKECCGCEWHCTSISRFGPENWQVWG